MSSASSQNMTVPLFKGQVSHSLSDKEWQRLRQKFQFSGDKMRSDKIMVALRLMGEYPTGRAQLREIIASNQIFKIECSRAGDMQCQKNYAGGYNEMGKTVVNSQMYDKPQQLGSVLLHELLHQRQPRILPMNPVIYDMETQALDIQLGLEMNSKVEECASYRQSYEKNLQKWREIRSGKRAKPAWAPDFVPVNIPATGSSLNRQQLLKQAESAYITQMATMETHAQYMEDFTASRQSISRGDFSLPVPSYESLRSNGFYDGDAIRRGLTTFRLSNAAKQYLHQQYPALNVSKVSAHADEIDVEHHGLNQTIDELKACLSSKITSGMTKVQVLKATSQSIKELNCEARVKRMLSTELVDLFREIKTVPNVKQIVTHLQNRYNETYRHSDGYMEIKEKRIDKQVNDIWQKAEKNNQNPYKVTFDFVANYQNLSTSAKWYQMAQIIKWHKNQYPEQTGAQADFRENMILQMRQILGSKGLPIVQNTSGLRDMLHQSSGGNLIDVSQSDLNMLYNDRNVSQLA